MREPVDGSLAARRPRPDALPRDERIRPLATRRFDPQPIVGRTRTADACARATYPTNRYRIVRDVAASVGRRDPVAPSWQGGGRARPPDGASSRSPSLTIHAPGSRHGRPRFDRPHPSTDAQPPVPGRALPAAHRPRPAAARARSCSGRVGRAAAPDLRRDAAHPRPALGHRLLQRPPTATAGRAAAPADERGSDLPLRAAAADDVPGHPRPARLPVPARAAHARAPLRLCGRQQVAGEGARGRHGDGGARGSSPASRARSLRGHAGVPTAAPAAVGSAADAAPGRPAAPVVPGAVVARGGRRRLDGRGVRPRRTWRLGTRPRGRRGCPRSTRGRPTSARARA